MRKRLALYWDIFFVRGNRMAEVKQSYEQLVEKHDNCEMLAKMYLDAGDVNLTVFYMNAALGFRLKAQSLQLKNVR